ncbi:MAG: sensor histidine kinase [Bryobacteraceae bacterium]
MIKSPTLRLLLGLLITLAAVTVFSSYSLRQLSGLRKLQTQTIDLNRRDSLLLFQIENELNRVGLRLRDMTEGDSGRGIAAYQGEFSQLQTDLGSAIHAEAALAPGAMGHKRLAASLATFWHTADDVFAAAAAGHEGAARRLAVTELSPQQMRLSALVSELVDQNNGTEVKADQKVARIYSRAESGIYAFLAATMLAIALISLYLIYSNRRIFQRIEFLSRQRRVLAARLISVQEEVLRSVSRELHDEFGQILTAVSAMLSRAERKGVPPDSPLRTELKEVREITHNTLEKMRSLSQMLHPAVIDDYGLANAIEWYAGVFERQTGIRTSVPVQGEPVRITGQPAIHCFRIVQEALTNAAKHAATSAAEVSLVFSDGSLTIHIRDFGCGMVQNSGRGMGLGFIAMQERAELIGGSLKVISAPRSGTTVSVTMPVRPDGLAPDAAEEFANEAPPAREAFLKDIKEVKTI